MSPEERSPEEFYLFSLLYTLYSFIIFPYIYRNLFTL